MRGEVAEHSAAAALTLVPPRQGALRMGGVVAEEADTDVRDRADLTGGDQFAGGRDGGRVAVVEADRALDARLGDGTRDGPRVLGGETDRLLDPQVFARLGHGDADLAVQEVRSGDTHRLDPGVGCDLTPVPGRRGEPVPRGGLLGPAGHLVGDRDQFRPYGQPREVVRHARVRLGVHPPHPAEPHDGDAERTPHECPSSDRFRTALVIAFGSVHGRSGSHWSSS